MILEEIKNCVINGNAKTIQGFVRTALDEGIGAKVILEEGLVGGMKVIGEQWEEGEIFVPEVLIAARALNKGLEVLEPVLVSSGFEPKATVIIGTVKGDLHDIGKNLVSLMLKGAGFKVVDLGVDVTKEKYAEAIKAHHAQAVCLSSLLTTTMLYMKDIISEISAQGVRDQVKIFIGGAPITQEFADKIGADYYAAHANGAVDILNKLF